MQNRQTLFVPSAPDLSHIEIKGLDSLTIPRGGDNVKAVVDVLILGAKESGKTQFLAHVARTLEMKPIQGLSAAETNFNGDLWENTQKLDYRMFATTATEVVHYVLQEDAGRLAEKVLDANFWAGLKIFSRRSGFFRSITLGIGAILAVHAALAVYLLPLFKPTPMGHWWLLTTFLLSATATIVRVWQTTRNALAESGTIEVVLWDFAGEHFIDNLAQHLAFIQTLVRRRQELHTLPGGAHYAFLPALIFDPLQVEICNSLRERLSQVVHYTLKTTSDVLIVIPRNRLLEGIRRLQDTFVGVVKKLAKSNISHLTSQPSTHPSREPGGEHPTEQQRGQLERTAELDQLPPAPVSDLPPEHSIRIIRPAEVSKACGERNLKRRIHRSRIRTLYYDADPAATWKQCQKKKAQDCIHRLAEAEERPLPLIDVKANVDGNAVELTTFLIYEYQERGGDFSGVENGDVFFDWIGSNIWPVNWDRMMAFVPPDPLGPGGSSSPASQSDHFSQPIGFSTGS
ncbi:hypothetical protein [Hyalangium versicolor]|uniref:hypothetical protein n=1 Tax=Hyalangium versicolor TaxID=2861190 RepID=UPI001CCDD580|nr:hypothetical protein [Hyalangium versicolor]